MMEVQEHSYSNVNDSGNHDDNHGNKVTLLGFYGGDSSHCLSAWQSTSLGLGVVLPDNVGERISVLFHETKKSKKKSSLELLKLLADHGHHTPFEKSCIHFQLRTDIATHIHLIKHRIGVSINSESARYKELDDKWYLPPDWECVEIEEGHLLSEVLDALGNPKNWQEVLDAYTDLGHLLYHRSCMAISQKLGRKRAKESCRYFLPYNKQLDYDVMFNFRSFMHFQGLRSSQHAQKEINEIAREMVLHVQAIEGSPFKESLEAFGY